MSAPPSGKGSDWLPPLPGPEDLTHLEPWRPSGIEELVEPAASREDPLWRILRYIVIDELHEQMAGLVLSPWPRVDERGRLRFGEEENSHCLAIGADALLGVLRERRIVPVAQDESLREALRERELTVGDAFAAFVIRPPGGDGGDGGGGGSEGGGGVQQDLSYWLRGPLLDVTVEARERAKAQASAAASGVIDEEYMELIEQESDEDDPGPGTTGGADGSNNPGGDGEADLIETYDIRDPAVAPRIDLKGAEELEEALSEPAREQPAERHGEDEMTMGT
jgi:hypothetical protein